MPRRGTSQNPGSRFERLHLTWERGEEPAPSTEFLIDRTTSILTSNKSPDIGFDWSVNPYRGCEHGCIYCYARPTHEYLGFSAGLDFESRILVKSSAPSLLRQELLSLRWRPRVVAMAGVTDPYQPVERKLRLTRRCLEVLAEVRNPVAVVTKNHLVTRDIDLLKELSRMDAAHVSISVTTLDVNLQRVMEPRTSIPERRLNAVEQLARNGIPVAVLVAPVIPGLTEHEIPRILTAARDHGAWCCRYQLLRLPHGVKDLFEEWLRRCFPLRAERVLRRIREVRSGKLSDSRFHHRMSGEGIYARQIEQLFTKSSEKLGFRSSLPELSCAAFRRNGQMRLPLG
ncbi:MAG: PA0069 family radical SAM protein [Acidobacteriota bacterium]|jgi:DNA repair photolyase